MEIHGMAGREECPADGCSITGPEVGGMAQESIREQSEFLFSRLQLGSTPVISQSESAGLQLRKILPTFPRRG